METITGRRRLMQGINASSSNTRSSNERQAINTACQVILTSYVLSDLVLLAEAAAGRGLLWLQSRQQGSPQSCQRHAQLAAV